MYRRCLSLLTNSIGAVYDCGMNDIAAIYECERPRIFNYLLSRTGDWHTAEDLTHDTFLAAVEFLPRWQERGTPFRSWLMQVAYVRMALYYYKLNRRVTLPLLDFDGDAPRVLSCDGGIEGVIEACDTAMAMALVRAIVATLTPREQQILAVFCQAERAREGAGRLGLTVAGYHTAIERLMTKLKWRLLGRGDAAPTYAYGQAPERCQQPGCERPHYCRGCCRRCYDRARRGR